MHQKDEFLLISISLMLLTIMVACGMRDPVVEPGTITPTLEIENETAVLVPTDTPEPVEMRALVICIGEEPETLYPYGTSTPSQISVLEALYDGPIDSRSFAYQAVIVEKVPSLADGDAVIQPVPVASGDMVVDSAGDPAILSDGLLVRPSGCSSEACAVVYDSKVPMTMDQMVVTFKLLPGLLWADGTPLTGADSVYAFNLATSPDTPADRFTIERTLAYQAPDDTTIQWTGLPGFLDSTYFLNLWTPLPQHIWGGVAPGELVTADLSSRAPIGYGPYTIQEWRPGGDIRLARNPNYFRADEGLPRFDTLIFRFVGQDSSTTVGRILSGECDILDQTTQLGDLTDRLFELGASGQLKPAFAVDTVFEHADFGIAHISYDDGWVPGERPDFFSDVRVRRALAHCFDRQAVVDTVLFGETVVLDTYIPTQHPLFNGDLPRYSFDTATGSALLDEAGWVMGNDGVRIYQGDNQRIPQGTRLSFNYSTTSASQRQQVAQILAQSLRTCGIEANLEFWDPGEYYAEGPEGPLFGRRFDIGQFAWRTGAEPPCDLYLSEAIPGMDFERFPYAWGGWNNTGYSNPEFDNACKAALESLPGQESYKENHLKAQEIFASDIPVVPLYLHLKVAASRPDMCHLTLDPTARSGMWNIEDFDYGDCS